MWVKIQKWNWKRSKPLNLVLQICFPKPQAATAFITDSRMHVCSQAPQGSFAWSQLKIILFYVILGLSAACLTLAVLAPPPIFCLAPPHKQRVGLQVGLHGREHVTISEAALIQEKKTREKVSMEVFCRRFPAGQNLCNLWAPHILPRWWPRQTQPQSSIFSCDVTSGVCEAAGIKQV